MNSVRPFQTKLMGVDQISQFRPNFTISAKFYNPGILGTPGVRAVSQFLRCLYLHIPVLPQIQSDTIPTNQTTAPQFLKSGQKYPRGHTGTLLSICITRRIHYIRYSRKSLSDFWGESLLQTWSCCPSTQYCQSGTQPDPKPPCQSSKAPKAASKRNFEWPVGMARPLWQPPYLR